jgi:transposase
MSLCSKIQVDLPKEGITIRRSGKYQTVYKVTSAYRNYKGQPTSKRVTIGKMDDESGKLIPNDKYWQYYGDTAIEILPSYDSVRCIGSVFLFTNILKSLGVVSILKKCFGKERGKEMLTAILYMACRNNIFEHVLDFCEGCTLYEKPLTSQSSSKLFSSITYDERMEFFREWVATQVGTSYLAYDVTSFSSYAQGITDTEWGYNRDGEKLPQINLGCYLSESTGLPIFYVTYPGSIVDKSHLQYMMAYNSELGINNIGFVMDRGFCTTSNIKYMAKSKLDFIIGAEIRHKSTKKTLDKVRDYIISMKNRTDQGIYALSVSDIFYGTTLTMHVYNDPSLAERQRRDLFRMVESWEEKLEQLSQLTEHEAKRYSAYFTIDRADDGTFTFKRNYDKIDLATLNSGFFCLLTNTKKDSTEMLSIYRKKDMIEKSFDDLKNHIDMKRMHTHNATTTDGKMFLAFIALIVISELQTKLVKMMRKKSWTKDTVIKELEKIKVITASGNRRLMSPVTKTQRLILETFGLNEDDLKGYVLGSISGNSVCA